MIKIMRDKWAKNSDLLKDRIDLLSPRDIGYDDLVKLVFDVVYNDEATVSQYGESLDTAHITKIDNGDYQGTILYVIPFKTYQPCENEYLMTYVGYGSCGGCDTLMSILDWSSWKDIHLTERQVNGVFDLCKDIAVNTIRPYNNGWRYNAEFDSTDYKNSEV